MIANMKMNLYLKHSSETSDYQASDSIDISLIFQLQVLLESERFPLIIWRKKATLQLPRKIKLTTEKENN